MSLRLDKSTWKRVTFGDVVRNVNDYYAPDVDGVLPYVAGPHISPGEPTVQTYGATDDDQFPPTFKRKFAIGDVLLHSRGIEKLAAVDRIGVTGEKLFVLRTIDGETLDQNFLVWLMKSPAAQSHMRDNFTGSVNKFLNWKPLANFEFDLPPLDEQERIADLLWAVERHRTSASGVSDRLVAAFRQGLPEVLAGSRRGELQSIADLAQVKHGYAFSGSGFSNDLQYPTVVTPGNVAIGGGFQEAAPKTFSGDYDASFVLNPGDVVITMTDLSKQGDTLGYSAVIPEGRTYLHNQRIGKMLLKPNAPVLPMFLMWVMRTPAYREHVLKTAAGSTVRHTSPTRIEQFRFLLPSIPDQERALETIGRLTQAMTSVGRESSALTVLRSSLVNDIFGDN